MTSVKLTKQELLDLLRVHEVEVEFTKADGTLRKMWCSLIPELLPPLYRRVDETTTKKENESVVKVFCLDIGEWRSFRVDSVISTNIRKAT